MKKLITILLLLVMICTPATVNAASVLKIRYSGKTVNYKDTRLKATYNGENINLSKNPGILMDKNGMVPFMDVFVNSAMKVKGSYNSKTKKITLKNGKNTVVMKLGSKTATVNGKSKKMPAAPVQVQYISSGRTKILVPSRFVAENLGFLYSWYSKTGTIAIENKGLLIEYGGNQYNYKGSTVEFFVDEEQVASEIPGILIGGYTLAPVREVLADSVLGVDYSYDEADKTLVLSANGNTMKLTIGKKEAVLNGGNITLPAAPLAILYKENNQTYIMVPVEYVTQKLGFYYEYDGTAKSASLYTKKPGKEPSAEELPNEIHISKGINTLSGITQLDDYVNRQYILTVPGNQVPFYTSNIPDIMDSSRASCEVSLNNQGNTDIRIRTNIIRGFKVTETDSEFVITIKAPKDMYSKIVFLDAGHGGSAKGAQGSNYGNNLIEKDVTLSIVKKMKEAADKNNDIKVYYSRLDDATVTNSERTKMANEIDGDIFVSVHINASTDTSAKGSLIMYSSKYDQTAGSGLSSSKMAYFLKPYLSNAVGSDDRAMLRGNIEVLNSSAMPAVLLEVAFLSNEEDVKILQDDTRLTVIAEGIYQGIKDLFVKYPPTR
ncbi:N-acetylmuramoyl-L-alanine amidase [Mobilisporobacter senegalensis]|uniref:N-acetylmuramoyl-L-alanine amidase n=1 Tax=Mobilisporobacter senegalensis TaxID=1329262 RepID=A0A3N1XTG4_9FIRM|nr:N-acetylmuramoyl-L-alanine amidase [Mobilisporobacter senegalensis]ROR28157.1 N-acetylmuramoyl-L-alanine amidase [Mobilisporobacter senegalensis]